MIMFKILCLIITPIAGWGIVTPYLSFYTPKSWPCRPFEPNWVCHHIDKQTSQPVMIIISANLQEKTKIKTVDQLLNNQSFQNPNKLFINKHDWIDSFYENSSLFNNFSNRYNKTSCCKEFSFAYYVDVGFYTPKNLYFNYSALFVKAINSFNLSRNAQAIKEALSNQDPKDLQEMNDYIHKILYGEEELESGPALPTKKGYSKGFYVFFLLLILSVAYGIYFFSFKKSKTKKRRKK